MKAKILSGVCAAALLYGSFAPAMAEVSQMRADGTRSVSLTQMDLLPKRFGYDGNGNQTETISPGGVEMKEYDILGRLTRYAGPNGVEEYAYLGAGHKRHSVKRTPAGGGAPELTTYLYDGDNVIAEYVGEDHVLSKTYVTAGLDENLSMTMHTGPDAGTYYYSQDGLGSVQALTDSSGMVRNSYDYTAFGEPCNTAVAVDQPYGYTGREVNPLSGDMHYRFREYNPSQGRFNRRDPLGYLSDRNLYSYVSNMPYSYVDPYGLALRICGPEKFRKDVASALKGLCSGLSFTQGQRGCWNVHMKDCPPKDDELCTGIRAIVGNGHDNAIEWVDDDFPLGKDGNGDISTFFKDKGVRTPLPNGDFGSGGGDKGTIMMKDREYTLPTKIYDVGDPAFSDKEKFPIPWPPALAHELGHVDLVNKGLHPDKKIHAEESEKNSIHWENLGWGKIKDPTRRKKYN